MITGAYCKLAPKITGIRCGAGVHVGDVVAVREESGGFRQHTITRIVDTREGIAYCSISEDRSPPRQIGHWQCPGCHAFVKNGEDCKRCGL